MVVNTLWRFSHIAQFVAAGLMLMATAGYDLSAAARVWTAGEKLFGTTPTLDDWISTHPTHQTRSANFAQWIPQAKRVQSQWMAAAVGTKDKEALIRSPFASLSSWSPLSNSLSARPSRRSPLAPKPEVSLSEMEKGSSLSE